MSSYRLWFEEHPEWLEAEERGLKTLGFHLYLDQEAKAAGRIEFRGRIRAGGKSHQIRLAYPDGYPYQHPLVFGPPHLLSRHQQPYQGELCVWPAAEQDWDWQRTDAGAYVLKNAVELIELSLKDPDAVHGREERFPDPRSRYYPCHPGASIIVPSDMYGMPKNAWGTMLILGPKVSAPSRGMAKRVRIDGPKAAGVREAPGSWRGLFTDSGEIEGYWVKVEQAPPFWSTPQEFHSSIFGWIAERHPRGEQILRWDERQLGWFGTRVRMVGVVFPDEERWHTAGDQWLFVLEWEGGEKLPVIAGQVRNTVVFRSHRVDEKEWFERIPQLAGLKAAKVAVVGLGALGSSVAVALARCGVGELYLVDKDVVEVGNLVRHEADIHSVGFDKVAAIGRKAFAANPTIAIEGLTCHFGAPGVLESVAAAIEGFDLVVNTFATDWGLNLIVNRLCYQLDIPQVHAWIGNGAWGGEVLRVIPGETACFECWCYWANDKSGAASDLRPVVSPEQLVAPVSCIETTFTGAGFDISTVSMATARLAVQTILRRQSADGYPDAPYHYSSLQLRQGEPFAGPITRSAEIPRYELCSTCGGGRV